jgi:hypothetical protein
MPFITGTAHASFKVAIDSGKFIDAKLHIPGSGTPDKNLAFTDTTVTVPDLPTGPSKIFVVVDFQPADPDATVTVSEVDSGTATAANPPGTIANDPANPGATITMFGA